MKKSILLPLLFLASGLLAQTQRQNALPSTGPMPNPPDPTQLGDFEPPTVVCLNGLNANILPTGMITIFAADVLQFVSDNATPVAQIMLGIRKAGTGVGFPLDSLMQPVTSVTLTCDEVGASVPLELWAMDASGNVAFCTTDLILQDNFGNCPGSNNLNVYICAKALCSGAALESATIQIEGNSPFAPPFSYFELLDASGCMHFFNNVPIAGNFLISVYKDSNPLNGMDEQDFTLLSKHINGTQPFTEPWQWVAADANRDGFVTLEDSIEFRKLMLGIYTELPNNTSWRFVPEGYQFPSPNPLSQPLPESISVADILMSMDTIFVGIKIGDLDCSSLPDFSNTPKGERYNLSGLEKTDPSLDPKVLGDYAPPTIVCKNTSVNISQGFSSDLPVWSAFQSVSDNATPNAELILSMRKAGAGTGFPLDAQGNPVFSLSFSCFDLGGQVVEVWAKDASGNAAHCEANLLVVNNLGDCPPGSGSGLPIIRACARTEATDGVEEIAYSVTGSNPNEPFYVNDYSDPSGGCGYFGVPIGSDVTVKPIKDDNPLNGVTTYDLVLISKHIRGLEPLNSPYKMIAADADRNGVIDSTDIVELYKLILGVYTELPNNTSWRFIPMEYVFPDAMNPFAETFPESATVQNIHFGASMDFASIKVGDVNNTAVANGTSPELDERSAIPDGQSASIGQVRPNPTAGAATLPIYLPIAENLHLEIYDLTGKLLWHNDLQLDPGRHDLEIPASAMPGVGLYAWRVWAGEIVKSGKLVRY